MKRILFVDDDVSVLEGLRLCLRKRLADWEMTFASSGSQALAELEGEPYHIIVSDLRIAGMHGGRLLRTVSERWPETIRIALSGMSDPEHAMRLASLAHQFLTKPCDARVLENVLDRCLKLQDSLHHPRLRAIVGRLHRLLPLRGTYAKLERALADENTNLQQVARIVAGDTIIAAKVLHLVNSAFFRASRRITNIEHAIAYLGFGTIRNVVLSAEIFEQWSAPILPEVLDLESLQQHSHDLVATVHALTADSRISDDATLAALLHDIGYWVLAHECPQELERAHATALAEGLPMHEAESRVIGASHAEIGAYLLGIWGLPYSVIEAVAHHHKPDAIEAGQFDPLAALVVAHALGEVGDECAFMSRPVRDTRVEAEYLAARGAPFSWSEAQRRVSAAIELTARG